MKRDVQKRIRDSTVRRHVDAWLQRYEPSPTASLRLVCFPHAGGSAAFYRAWAASQGLDLEVLAVQYPGRMNRFDEPLVDNAGAMADILAEVLSRNVLPPFAFFGHSMGAMIAFETTQRLAHEHRLHPVRLFVSARKGPLCHKPGERYLADDERLVSYLRRLGGCEDEVFQQPHLLPMILPIIRNDIKLAETWAPRSDARVDCPITAFVGNRDPEVTIEEATSWEQATEDFEIRVFDGHHFYLTDHRSEVMDHVVRRCDDELRRQSMA
jgi:pyochelin biosynthetic protein PchC